MQLSFNRFGRNKIISENFSCFRKAVSTVLFCSSTLLCSTALATDHNFDGDWVAKYSCGPNRSGDPGWSDSKRLKITNGVISNKFVNSKKTDWIWEGTIEESKLRLRAKSLNGRNDTEKLEIRYVEKTVSRDSIFALGEMFNNGDKRRDCAVALFEDFAEKQSSNEVPQPEKLILSENIGESISERDRQVVASSAVTVTANNAEVHKFQAESSGSISLLSKDDVPKAKKITGVSKNEEILTSKVDEKSNLVSSELCFQGEPKTKVNLKQLIDSCKAAQVIIDRYRKPYFDSIAKRGMTTLCDPRQVECGEFFVVSESLDESSRVIFSGTGVEFRAWSDARFVAKEKAEKVTATNKANAELASIRSSSKNAQIDLRALRQTYNPRRELVAMGFGVDSLVVSLSPTVGERVELTLHSDSPVVIESVVLNDNPECARNFKGARILRLGGTVIVNSECSGHVLKAVVQTSANAITFRFN